MLNRLWLANFRFFGIPSELRPRAHEPSMDQKTRADIRREILSKLTPRMRALGVSNSWQ
jgi:hypothetical protein